MCVCARLYLLMSWYLFWAPVGIANLGVRTTVCGLSTQAFKTSSSIEKNSPDLGLGANPGPRTEVGFPGLPCPRRRM